jgi:hypothetical protein
MLPMHLDLIILYIIIIILVVHVIVSCIAKYYWRQQRSRVKMVAYNFYPRVLIAKEANVIVKSY